MPYLFFLINFSLLLIFIFLPTYFLMRYYFVKKFNLSLCPKCNYPIRRVKRKSTDKWIASFLNLSLERFKCEYFACHFEGIRVIPKIKSDFGIYQQTHPLFFDTEKKLIESLDKNELCNYYQPQLDLDTNVITGMEALLRWHHPRAGQINPSLFLDEIEKNKFILTIGNFLIENACDQTKIWQENILDEKDLNISFNMSFSQFYDKNLVKKISRILEDTNLNPKCFEIEINEKTLMHNVKKSKNILYDLRNIGIKIAVDNFGLDNSSILSLKELPLTTLKIDRIWIQNIEQKSRQQDLRILESLISLGRALNLKIVAVGVETNEQLDILRGLGCNVIQGFLIQPALNVEDSTTFLQNKILRKVLVS